MRFLDIVVHGHQRFLLFLQPQMVLEGYSPLLLFVNVKSGGCQGIELVSSFRKLLNPHQIFNLDAGGPLPGCVLVFFIFLCRHFRADALQPLLVELCFLYYWDSQFSYF